MRGIVCSRCRTIHEVGKACPICEARRNKLKNKNYNDKKRDKKLQKFYLGKEWSILRSHVLDYYCGVDIWILGLEGRLQPCKRPIVHHIQPYSTNPALALVFSNLCCVSSASHNEIHEYYSSGRYEKAVEIIKQGIAKYEEIKNGQRIDFGKSTEE